MREISTIYHFRLFEDAFKCKVGNIIDLVWDGEQFCLAQDDYGTWDVSLEDILAVAVEVTAEEKAAFLNDIYNFDPSTIKNEIAERTSALIGGDATNTETSLVVANKFAQFRNGALELSRKADDIRAIVANNAQILKQHAAALRIKVKIEQEKMQAKMAEIEKQMAVLGHALHMANLYLGAGENVVPLREGERAPATEPLQIRQRLLYMDEECALLNECGIDYSNISRFDEYVLRPDLLELILPEKKGIVAIRPCRKLPQYAGADPTTQMMLNKENAKTYWLMRNGEALWRFWADFDAPSKIFPDRIQDVSPDRPGSPEYYKQMEDGIDTQRIKYMKAGLFVQGVIDRTLIFAPFPTPKPSLTDPDSWNGMIVFIYDSEASLGEGKMPFAKWLAETNKRLLPGHRIVTTGWLPDDNDAPSVFPRGACGYNANEIWSIESDSRGFFFRFPRTDWHGKESNRRGTYVVAEGANYYINFDAANEDDFDHYMVSRETRADFKTMIPLLRRCKELKANERETEKPFRQLLKSILIRDGGEEDAVESALDGLILWWKAKNKNFRSLVGDENTNRAALNAICTRFVKRTSSIPSINQLPIPDHNGLVLAVAKDERTVFAYFQADPLFPTFAHKHTFKATRGVWKQAETQNWVHIPQSAIASPDRIFVDSKLILNRPVKDDGFIAKPILDQLASRPLRENPLVVCKGRKLTAYAVVAVLSTREMELFLVATDDKNKLSSYPLRCDKGMFSISGYPQGSHRTFDEKLAKGELKTGDIYSDAWRSYYVVVSVSRDDQHEFVKHSRIKEAMGHLDYYKREYRRRCLNALESFYKTQWRDDQFAAYVKQGGDTGFFEDHLRTVKEPSFLIEPLSEVLTELLFEAGWTPKRVWSTPTHALLDNAKLSHSERERGFFDRSKIPADMTLPDRFTLPHYSKTAAKNHAH